MEDKHVDDEWYPYFEFPNRYEINKNGQVRNRTTKKILMGMVKRNDGYLYYGLRDENGKTFSRAAHIMVARQFIPCDDELLVVNHIDENRANPCLDNLEWITRSENSLHGTAQSRKAVKLQKHVNEYTKDGKYVRTWKTLKYIAEFVEGTEISSFRDNKTYNRMRVIAEKNAKDIKKRLMFDRIFVMMEEDSFEDLIEFDLAVDKGNSKDKRKDVFDGGINIPSESLYTAECQKQNIIDILENMLSWAFLRDDERRALEYAINCIDSIEES